MGLDVIDHSDLKNLIDFASAGAAIGTLAQVLPTAAAAASLIWTVIRIGEWLIAKLKPDKES